MKIYINRYTTWHNHKTITREVWYSNIEERDNDKKNIITDEKIESLIWDLTLQDIAKACIYNKNIECRLRLTYRQMDELRTQCYIYAKKKRNDFPF